jgi:hypothetical protein
MLSSTSRGPSFGSSESILQVDYKKLEFAGQSKAMLSNVDRVEGEQRNGVSMEPKLRTESEVK